MEFLEGLRQARSLGLSKEEFYDIWTKEINLKQQCASSATGQVTNSATEVTSATTTQIAEAATPGNDPRDDDDDSRGIKSILREMSQQLQDVKLLQEQVQEQQKVLSQSHRQLQQLQRHTLEEQDKRHDSVLHKLCQIEGHVNKLDQSISVSVKNSFDKEGGVLRDNLLEMVQTNHNHTVYEIQKMKAGLANDISQLSIDALRKMTEQICTFLEERLGTVLRQQQLHDSKESSSKPHNTKANENSGHDDPAARSKMTPTHSSKEEMLGKELEKSEKSKCSPVTTTEGTLRTVIHEELNTLILELQKLILKPVTSKDIVLQVADRIKGILADERMIHSKSLQEVQTAISDEIKGRLCQLQQSITGHILKAVQDLSQLGSKSTQSEKQACLERIVKLEISNVTNDFGKLREEVTTELPSRIVENLLQELKDVLRPNGATSQVTHLGEESGAMPRVKPTNYQQADIAPLKLHDTMLIVLVMQTVMTMLFSDLLDKEQQLKQSRSDSVTTGIFGEASGPVVPWDEQVMTLCNKQHLNSSTSTESQSEATFLERSETEAPKDVKATSVSTEKATDTKARAEAKHSEQSMSKQLTDAYLTLYFGGQKPDYHQWCVNSVSSLIRRNATESYQITVSPGYNLRLLAEFQTQCTEFSLQAVCGDRDASLGWPVELQITVFLQTQQPLDDLRRGAKPIPPVIKRKTLFQPNFPQGHSKSLFLHYFKMSEMVDHFIHNDSLIVCFFIDVVGWQV